MSETPQAAQKASHDGKITDEDIDRQRRQIGISQHNYGNAFNRLVSEDGIRHFAFGMIGDDNPLWHEPEYAANTRWRGQIAPPLFASATGVNEAPRPATPEMKALFKGLYRGVGRYNVGTQWQFFRPIRSGDKLFEDQSVAEVQVKEKSAFSGSRTVLEKYRHLYVNSDGEPVAVRYESFVNAERSGSQKEGKYADVKRHVYSKEEIEAIDRHYAGEERRGAEPRWWEDVAEGEDLVPVIKGPMGLVEIIGAHLGWGFGSTYGGGPLRYTWLARQRLKNFYVEDKYGVPGSMMRVHWDHDRAQELGLPSAYDYAQMRSNWVAHAVTNWMGDDAWISELNTEVRLFNFHGDTSLVTGKVTGKRVVDGDHLVDIDLRLTNQRQEITTIARATVMLPSKPHGPVSLPNAGRELAERGAMMMDEAARRRRANAG